MSNVKLLYGIDVLEGLKQLKDESVHCCVTSPPYWGLRDYKVEGQIGLEKTPEEYVAKMVAVFREVKRVLRKDGTLWLNLGDSYSGSMSTDKAVINPNSLSGRSGGQTHGYRKEPRGIVNGLKPKDLVGIPWSVAKALQQPYYLGRIKNEKDRVWLAAMIDAEGTICGFTHKRKDNGEIRRGIHITITNSNRAILDEAYRIWPTSRQDHNAHGIEHFGKLDTWRWIAHDVEEKSLLLQELLPYFIGKKKQALLAWNFLQISKQARGRNKGEEGDSNREKSAWIVHALSKLNHLEDVSVPDWIKEPESLFEPGWYLRSDCIWSKANPMPESVTDRPTKSHEYIFLLTRSPKYYYDAEAIKETCTSVEERPFGVVRDRIFNYDSKQRVLQKRGKQAFSYNTNEPDKAWEPSAIRNKRSVWTIATQPYPEAHFATFPEEIPRICILAGCPVNGVVLDPFSGSGTTGEVALKLGRSYIGIDLNTEYLKLAKERIGLFAFV